MHHIEDIFMLAPDHHTDLLSKCNQISGHLSYVTCICCINDHHHVKVPIYNRLGNIQDIYLVISQIGADFCDM